MYRRRRDSARNAPLPSTHPLSSDAVAQLYGDDFCVGLKRSQARLYLYMHGMFLEFPKTELSQCSSPLATALVYQGSDTFLHLNSYDVSRVLPTGYLFSRRAHRSRHFEKQASWPPPLGSTLQKTPNRGGKTNPAARACVCV